MKQHLITAIQWYYLCVCMFVCSFLLLLFLCCGHMVCFYSPLLSTCIEGVGAGFLSIMLMRASRSCCPFSRISFQHVPMWSVPWMGELGFESLSQCTEQYRMEQSCDWFSHLLLLSSGFLWIQASYPRFRYDQLIHLFWKSFLPITLALCLWHTSIPTCSQASLLT